nr:hypothetical protein CFP56_38850 [Quercus suber]
MEGDWRVTIANRGVSKSDGVSLPRGEPAGIGVHAVRDHGPVHSTSWPEDRERAELCCLRRTNNRVDSAVIEELSPENADAIGRRIVSRVVAYGAQGDSASDCPSSLLICERRYGGSTDLSAAPTVRTDTRRSRMPPVRASARGPEVGGMWPAHAHRQGQEDPLAVSSVGRGLATCGRSLCLGASGALFVRHMGVKRSPGASRNGSDARAKQQGLVVGIYSRGMNPQDPSSQ